MVAAFVVIGAVLSPKASALSGADFDKSNIIDDSVFFDKGTMSVSQIRSFLDAKVPVCDTNGSEPSGRSGYATRADWGRANGVPPPYTCLKDYTQTHPTRSANSYCGRISGGTRGASSIIYVVARECGINPQVLIVLLQKEQSLVTDEWPWPIQYRSATGYGCPDTAPCDSDYYGFFNQVYNAAKQYKRYAKDSELFNYKANRNNVIYRHPGPCKTYSNGSCVEYYGRFGDRPDIQYCGSSTVYIQNQATAGLYNYTPYQPNAAALANLYGTGDTCSSYGNRNFWRMFNDWFGSTIGSYLLRSPNSGTVYLVADDKKYPIPNYSTINALYPLGKVRYVSGSYLASKSTQPTLKRLVKGPGATIYFFDAGIKLGFTSCAMVAHYGMSCGDAAELTELQINKLVDGPNMTNAFNTTSGKSFIIEDSKKREALNDASKVAAGYNSPANSLKESAISYLQYGVPIVKSDSQVKDRSTKRVYLFTNNIAYRIPSAIDSLGAFTVSSSGFVDNESMSELTINTSFNGYAYDGSNHYLFDNSGKVRVTNSADYSGQYTTLPTSLLNQMDDSVDVLSNNKFARSYSNSTVYRVESGNRHAISSWKDLILLDKTPEIVSLPNHYISRLTKSYTQYGPTRLIKASNNNTVYMIDGYAQKIPLASFEVAKELGIMDSIVKVSAGNLASYSNKAGVVNLLVSCGGVEYLARGGILYEMDAGAKNAYGLNDGDFYSYDSTTCLVLNKSDSVLTQRYVRPIDGNTIYYINNGTKQPFTSYSAYTTHGGTSNNTTAISNSVLSEVPTGSAL